MKLFCDLLPRAPRSYFILDSPPFQHLHNVPELRPARPRGPVVGRKALVSGNLTSVVLMTTPSQEPRISWQGRRCLSHLSLFLNMYFLNFISRIFCVELRIEARARQCPQMPHPSPPSPLCRVSQVGKETRLSQCLSDGTMLSQGRPFFSILVVRKAPSGLLLHQGTIRR